MYIDSAEIVGIIATLIILASYTLSDIKNIRRLNILGSVMFVAYGVLIHALSVWLLNGACIVVHIYKLCKNKADR